jgi:hypothetical protein
MTLYANTATAFTRVLTPNLSVDKAATDKPASTYNGNRLRDYLDTSAIALRTARPTSYS